jgi:hypothetical protein
MLVVTFHSIFIATPSKRDSRQLLYQSANNAPEIACIPSRPTLVGSTGDEEPLVNARVNWCRGKVLVGWDSRKLVRGDTAWGVLDGKVGAVAMLDSA